MGIKTMVQPTQRFKLRTGILKIRVDHFILICCVFATGVHATAPLSDLLPIFMGVAGGLIVFGALIGGCLWARSAASNYQGPDKFDKNYITPLGPVAKEQDFMLVGPPKRRLLHNPFYSLAHELGLDVNVAMKPNVTSRRCLTERQQLLPESLRSNLWWILPVSCITQIMWILLGVYLKRTCTKVLRGRKSETKAIPRR